MTYDTVIIGGGPAAVAAGVYCARKRMKTAFIADQIGGQSIVSDGIANWIGDTMLTGVELAKKLETHLKAQEDIELQIPARATAVDKKDKNFVVTTEKGDTFETKTVIITTGGRHRRLNVPGEEKFEGKGVAYCATCDAPFFRDKDVAVVGGGNSGLEAIVDLMPYAKTIHLLVRSDQLKGDPITQEQVLEAAKKKQVNIIYHADTKEILGDAMVSGLRYQDLESKEEKELAVNGVFVEIGSVPNSEIVKDVVDTNDYNEIVVDHKTGATSVPGIFAAGDVTDELYKQNNIAVGDAVTAALSAYEYVRKN